MRISVLSNSSAINTCVDAMRNQMLDINPINPVIGLDCEWDIVKNAQGFITGSKKIAIMQIGYIVDAVSKALIFQVHRINNLPQRLLALFEDTRFSYAGINVGGDINKIGDNFNIKVITSKMKKHNLGLQARKRDVIKMVS